MKKDTSLKITKDKSANEKLNIPCLYCKGDTNHEVLSSIDLDGSQDCGGGNFYDWCNNYQIVKCCGCDDISFRKVHTNSEDWDGRYDHKGNEEIYYVETENLYPDRKSERSPVQDYYLLPSQLQTIYLETLTAINSNQPVLTGIGIRAIIETVCKTKKTTGNLKNKINELVTLGVLTTDGAKILHQLRVLGNASAHEAKPHTSLQLSLALDVIDHLLQGVYILPFHSKSTF